MGGHSLLAMRVLTRIEQTLGAAVRVREFFEAHDIASLASRIARTRAEARQVSVGNATPNIASLSW